VVICQPRVSISCGWSFRPMESAIAAATGCTALRGGGGGGGDSKGSSSGCKL
jgi:hypothetical protein